MPEVQIGIQLTAEDLLQHPDKIYRIRHGVDILNGMAPPQPFAVPNTDPWGMPDKFLELPSVIDMNYSEDFNMNRTPHPMSLLAMRMKWGVFNANREFGATVQPFDHISIHVGKEVVYVFIVKDGTAVTLEDDPNMFPSDELVGRIRLLD